METIKTIVKVIATIVACLAFVLMTGEAENANLQLLWSGGCLFVLWLSCKAMVWADPSLLEDEEV